MDIIPVLDILDNKVVKAIKGDRANYKPISSKLYNSIEPIEIINQLSKRYSPHILYIADLDAISNNNVNHALFNQILTIFPKIVFWIDTGMNTIKLKKKFRNYVPIICSENSKGFDLISNLKYNYICSLDIDKCLLGIKPIHKHKRYLPKKIIIMDLLQVGSKNKFNHKNSIKFMKKDKRDYYIAGGIKNILDIKKAKKLGAKGVLVSSILHNTKLNKIFIQKEKTSL